MVLDGHDRRDVFEATCVPLTRTLYAVAVRLTRKPEDASDVVCVLVGDGPSEAVVSLAVAKAMKAVVRA
jgi:hypothetical protein